MSDDPIGDALKMMPYGFYAVTSHHKDDVNIMVANWITQASFEPRLVAFGLQKTSYTYGLVENGRVFAVNILHAEDEEVIKAFTKSREKNPDKVAEAEFTPGPETGCPVLEDAIAYFEVRVRQIVDTGGDHNVVIGEVIGAGVREEAEPDEVLTLPDLGWNYAG